VTVSLHAGAAKAARENVVDPLVAEIPVIGADSQIGWRKPTRPPQRDWLRRRRSRAVRFGAEMDAAALFRRYDLMFWFSIVWLAGWCLMIAWVVLGN